MKAVVSIEFDRENMQKMFAMRMSKEVREFNSMSDTELLQVCLSSITKPYAIKVTDIRESPYEDVLEIIDAGVCDYCKYKDFDDKCFNNCTHELEALKDWLEVQK